MAAPLPCTAGCTWKARLGSMSGAAGVRPPALLPEPPTTPDLVNPRGVCGNGVLSSDVCGLSRTSGPAPFPIDFALPSAAAAATAATGKDPTANPVAVAAAPPLAGAPGPGGATAGAASAPWWPSNAGQG